MKPASMTDLSLLNYLPGQVKQVCETLGPGRPFSASPREEKAATEKPMAHRLHSPKLGEISSEAQLFGCWMPCSLMGPQKCLSQEERQTTQPVTAYCEHQVFISFPDLLLLAGKAYFLFLDLYTRCSCCLLCFSSSPFWIIGS